MVFSLSFNASVLLPFNRKSCLELIWVELWLHKRKSNSFIWVTYVCCGVNNYCYLICCWLLFLSSFSYNCWSGSLGWFYHSWASLRTLSNANSNNLFVWYNLLSCIFLIVFYVLRSYRHHHMVVLLFFMLLIGQHELMSLSYSSHYLVKTLRWT